MGNMMKQQLPAQCSPLWSSLRDADQHAPFAVRAGPVADDLRACQVGGAVKHLNRSITSTLQVSTQAWLAAGLRRRTAFSSKSAQALPAPESSAACKRHPKASLAAAAAAAAAAVQFTMHQ
jgi:hypothetical protein